MPTNRATHVKERAELVRWGASLCNRGILHAARGNISVRAGSSMLITPSEKPKRGTLEAGDIVEIDIATGHSVESAAQKPPIWAPFHIALYRQRPDVKAVVHCHPTYATLLAARRIKITPGIMAEGVAALGSDVPLIVEAPAGMGKLADALHSEQAASSTPCCAFLLSKSGTIAVGSNLTDAIYRAETIEFIAQLQFNKRVQAQRMHHDTTSKL